MKMTKEEAERLASNWFKLHVNIHSNHVFAKLHTALMEAVEDSGVDIEELYIEADVNLSLVFRPKGEGEAVELFGSLDCNAIHFPGEEKDGVSYHEQVVDAMEEATGKIVSLRPRKSHEDILGETEIPASDILV